LRMLISRNLMEFTQVVCLALLTERENCNYFLRIEDP
jgi:hypothetical protein